MGRKRIFMTGASGCIGHYLTDRLIQTTNHDLYLLVRTPAKLQFNPQARPGITLLQGDLEHIEHHADLLKTIDTAILAATAWGDPKTTATINVDKTLALLNLLNPDQCERVFYFSTASILGRDNQPLAAAGTLGTDYIRTKYECYQRLAETPIADRITTLFPTLVLGGGPDKPYSHLSAGIAEVVRWIDLIRFFQADASFHYIHAQDIAQVVTYLVDSPLDFTLPRMLVLGNPAITVNQAIAETCRYLNRRIYFRIPLTPWLANVFITLFHVQMADWDRFCLQYRHFTYQNPANPATFGLTPYCDTFAKVLAVSGIPVNGKEG
ncbi:NAD-dependent epimerase/dehydratase family protein [Trichothermofontia sp.]